MIDMVEDLNIDIEQKHILDAPSPMLTNQTLNF